MTTAIAEKSPVILQIGTQFVLSQIETGEQATICLASLDNDKTVCYFDSGKVLVNKDDKPIGLVLEPYIMSALPSL
jgi:hypothetical protein